MLDEALKQPQRDNGNFARSLPDAQDPLVALVVHAERREHVVATELDAVELDNQIVPVVKPPLRQRKEVDQREQMLPAVPRRLPLACSSLSPVLSGRPFLS